MRRSNKETSRFDPEIIEGVFTDLSQDELYERRDGGDAELIRRALLRAQELREAGADAGDALMEGVAATLEVVSQQTELNTQELLQKTRRAA